MSTKLTLQNHKTFLLLFFFLVTLTANAQIGIGTTTPDATSILDITSTTKGMLAPRMTTVQRNAITTPAQGLLVYDTDLKLFYYYSTPSGWLPLLNSSVGRTNFKRVKSAADLAPELAAGGSVYQLSSNTLYEINGTITLAAPINLNDAYVTGIDTNEDILLYPGGTIFQGTTGGSIRNVTLRGASRAFNITGGGALLVQNTIIDGMTTSVGTISGLALYFGNIIQFVNNTTGITYSTISSLLLSNQAWFSSNNGTFETLTGTFGLIQKNSGFSTVDASDVALDVSNASLAVGTGIILGTVFSGTTTAPSGYIKGYAAASTYTGYFFSNAWTVDAPGIMREADSEATGDINLNASVGSSALTTLSGTGSGSRKKIFGTTTSNNLFRFARDGDNRIVYKGTKTRYFQVIASVSYQTNTDATLVIYIAKNGNVLTETKVYGRGSGGLLSSAPIIALPSVGTVQMKTDDNLEVWVERYEGSANMSTVSLNLTAR
ncbi:autotransporter outer membrane beta-barrel domain-containing protein [Flavobacterium bizetiae]|uniref:hypothetical protein n=1 Tax=Flavobacterium bizetiae TaxID=2704140 RepID=UPI0037571A39